MTTSAELIRINVTVNLLRKKAERSIVQKLSATMKLLRLGVLTPLISVIIAGVELNKAGDRGISPKQLYPIIDVVLMTII